MYHRNSGSRGFIRGEVCVMWAASSRSRLWHSSSGRSNSHWKMPKLVCKLGKRTCWSVCNFRRVHTRVYLCTCTLMYVYGIWLQYWIVEPLARTLHERQTSFTGTTMRNRAGLPQPIRTLSRLADNQVKAFRDGPLMALEWRAPKSKLSVIMVSTAHPLTWQQFNSNEVEVMLLTCTTTAWTVWYSGPCRPK